MDKKTLIVNSIVLVIIQCILNLGIFVTYQQMVAYAAPKDDITKIETQLNRIEEKVDKLILRR